MFISFLFLYIPLLFIGGFVGLIMLAKYLIGKNNYENSTYFSDKHQSYMTVMRDKGASGEFRIYDKLRRYEERGAKFLFNIYIPVNYKIAVAKDNEPKKTTEIDVMMIDKSGVYVFESKNYSGWIFGDENSDKWTQTLRAGRTTQKERFYNPIKQNNSHIKHLTNLLNEKNISFTFPVHNVIVFSNRCTLKKVTVNSNDIHVLQLDDLNSLVYRENVCDPKLSDEQIKILYDILYPYTQVSEEVKQQHINDVNDIKN